LVADDAAEIRTLVRITLQSQGWVVHEAASTVAALEMAEDIRPDAVLLDVVFSGEADDGFVVCRKLRRSPATSLIPVVMLTARSTASDRAIAQRAGATAYLPKPFGPIDLISTLRSILGLPGSTPAIGLLLVDEGRIRPEQLETTLQEQEHFRNVGLEMPLGEMLLRRGNVKPEDVERALDRQRASTAIAEDTDRRIRVVIADDHLAIRDGLRAMLVEEDGFNVVGIATDGEEALWLIRDRRPDVAVLDQDLRKRSGLELVEIMRNEQIPTMPIIYSFDAAVREPALAAGAAFVNKDAHPAALAAEVRRASGGPAHFRPPSRLAAARAASTFAMRAMARQRRAVGILGVLAVGYAGAFLVSESLLGAGAALLAIVAVALAGALIGPEAGVLAAIVAGIETLLLWSGTGHAPGEPVLVVGGNALGLLSLMGIGAGFGAMRLLRGQVRRHDRQIDALIEGGILLGGAGPQSLPLVTEAAREIVAADAVLTYAAAESGALEVVATVGAPPSLMGQRELAEFGPVQRVYAEARPRVLGERDARSFIPGMRSAVVVPACPIGERPRGVLVALSASRVRRLDGADAAALLRFAPSAWLALKLAGERRMGVEREPIRRASPSPAPVPSQARLRWWRALLSRTRSS
jgi:DNA-binding response OmpR family regulator